MNEIFGMFFPKVSKLTCNSLKFSKSPSLYNIDGEQGNCALVIGF